MYWSSLSYTGLWYPTELKLKYSYIYIKSYLNLYNVAYLTFCLLIVQHALLAPPLPNCNLFSTPDRKIGDPSVAVFEFLYVDNLFIYLFFLIMHVKPFESPYVIHSRIEMHYVKVQALMEPTYD